jgi:SAM-dependent methyltransferase
MNWVLILLIIVLVILIAVIMKRVLNEICPIIFRGSGEIVDNRLVCIEDARNDNEIPYVDDITGIELKYKSRKKYIDPQTNRQISYVLKNGNSREIARLYELIARFRRNDKNIMQLLSRDDSSIYKMIQVKSDSDVNLSERADFHSENLFRILKNNKITFPVDCKYLDIGCMDGSITKSLAQHIGAKEIHCIEPDPKNKTPGVEFSTSVEKYPFDDNHFDLVTAFMTLHHIPNVELIVKEIFRVLKPGGLFFIKEHDCWSTIDCMLVDIEHCVHMTMSGELEPGKLLPKDYFISYRNYHAFNKLLSELKFIKADYYYPNVRNEMTSTRAFYAIFQKN